jgi:acyl transferase domain-containing protein
VVSSFGFSGTNVHMVLEEAPSTERPTARRSAHLMTLSALGDAQLRQQAERLATHCEATPGLHCGDASFTLMMGRRHLGHRLACVVSSPGELARVLREWLADGRASGVFHGQVPENGAREDAERRRHGDQCVAECSAAAETVRAERLAVIAALYVQGYSLAYDRLFEGDAHRRIPLPTYPFVRERYWVPDASGAASDVVAEAAPTTSQRGRHAHGHRGHPHGGHQSSGHGRSAPDHSALDRLLEGVADGSVSVDAAALDARAILHSPET